MKIRFKTSKEKRGKNKQWQTANILIVVKREKIIRVSEHFTASLTHFTNITFLKKSGSDIGR